MLFKNTLLVASLALTPVLANAQIFNAEINTRPKTDVYYIDGVTISNREPNRIDNEYIVWLSKSANADALARKYGMVVKQKLAVDYALYLLEETTFNSNTLNYLKNEPGVLIAQHNHNVQLRATIPNDASFAGQQWSLNNTGQTGGTADADIDAPEAWDITTGGLTSAGDTIVVAVIDGGFQLNHPDLQQNIFRNRGEIAGNNIDFSTGFPDG